MKTVIAVNGSPRKNGNTATLLYKALKGAESEGAVTEMVHLYDLNYKGCISCFACKRKDRKYEGKCAVKDGLSPLLEKAMESHALILGSPVYLSDITGEMRSFIERLIFMNLSYENKQSTFAGRIHMAFIYTMNVSAEIMKQMQYDDIFRSHSTYANFLGGKSSYMTSNDTYQFDDYGLYAAGAFDEDHKAKVREEQFPIDCENAYELGKIVMRP